MLPAARNEKRSDSARLFLELSYDLMRPSPVFVVDVEPEPTNANGANLLRAGFVPIDEYRQTWIEFLQSRNQIANRLRRSALSFHGGDSGNRIVNRGAHTGIVAGSE